MWSPEPRICPLERARSSAWTTERSASSTSGAATTPCATTVRTKTVPCAKGRLRPLVISSGVYQIDYQQEGLVLKCPWHQWEFDLATGQALYDETMRVKTYEAEREGEEVVVYVE